MHKQVFEKMTERDINGNKDDKRNRAKKKLTVFEPLHYLIFER